MPDKKRIRINVDDEANEDWLKNDEEREIAAAVAGKKPTKAVDKDAKKKVAEAELEEIIAQVTREYGDKLKNMVYRAWNTIKNIGYQPADVVKEGIKAQLLTDHKSLIRELAPQAYAEGLREGGVNPEEQGLDDDDKAIIKDWIDGQLQHVNNFVQDVVDATGDEMAQRAILDRTDVWVGSMRTLGELGIASAKQNMMVTWKLNVHHITHEHCQNDHGKGTTGCEWLDGKRHRMKWFIRRGLVPRENGSKTLTCGGWLCGCGLVNDAGEVVL